VVLLLNNSASVGAGSIDRVYSLVHSDSYYYDWGNRAVPYQHVVFNISSDVQFYSPLWCWESHFIESVGRIKLDMFLDMFGFYRTPQVFERLVLNQTDFGAIVNIISTNAAFN